MLPSLNGKLKRCGSKVELSPQKRKYMARVDNTRKEYSKQKKIIMNNDNIANCDNNI